MVNAPIFFFFFFIYLKGMNEIMPKLHASSFGLFPFSGRFKGISSATKTRKKGKKN